MKAIERYEGVYFRVIKKYLRENKLEGTDLLIVSEKFGLLKPENVIPPHDTFQGSLKLHVDIEAARLKNLKTLQTLLGRRLYSEIFVVVGKDFLPLIQGFESLTEAKVTYAAGPGLGPKASNLKKWILQSS